MSIICEVSSGGVVGKACRKKGKSTTAHTALQDGYGKDVVLVERVLCVEAIRYREHERKEEKSDCGHRLAHYSPRAMIQAQQWMGVALWTSVVSGGMKWYIMALWWEIVVNCENSQ